MFQASNALLWPAADVTEDQQRGVQLKHNIQAIHKCQDWTVVMPKSC